MLLSVDLRCGLGLVANRLGGGVVWIRSTDKSTIGSGFKANDRARWCGRGASKVSFIERH